MSSYTREYKKRDREIMCRNIRSLFNFDPPATDAEIYDASLQYIRKLSGFPKPSKINEIAFNHAVEEISFTTKNLLNILATNAPKKNREIETKIAREKSAKRFNKRHNR